MRYNIGDQVTFVWINYTRSSFCGTSSFCPWSDKLTSIDLRIMTCTEHHRVPGEWDDEIQYDGFFFKDHEDRTWVNQWPRAAYGQISEDANYYVSPKTQEDDPNPNAKFVCYEDVEILMERILRGIRNFREAGDMEVEAQSLLDFYQKLVAMLDERGITATEVAIWEEHPEITTVRLTYPAKADAAPQVEA